jgi:flagellar protein FliJ
MSPTRRLQLVQRVTDDKERRHAQRLALSLSKVTQAEAKLAELEGYLRSYQQDLKRQTTAGIGVVKLREFQAFLAKLEEAVRQQGEIVERVRNESEAQRKDWQGAARRSKIVDKVVEKRLAEESRAVDARAQRESDEHGQLKGRRHDGH